MQWRVKLAFMFSLLFGCAQNARVADLAGVADGTKPGSDSVRTTSQSGSTCCYYDGSTTVCGPQYCPPDGGVEPQCRSAGDCVTPTSACDLTPGRCEQGACVYDQRAVCPGAPCGNNAAGRLLDPDGGLAGDPECPAGLFCVDGVCCTEPTCTPGASCNTPEMPGLCRGATGTACNVCGYDQCYGVQPTVVGGVGGAKGGGGGYCTRGQGLCVGGACTDTVAAANGQSCPPFASSEPCRAQADGVCQDGECIVPPAEDGTTCGDANDPCMVYRCQGGACVGTPALVGTQCNDSNVCTVDDRCDAAGVCRGTANLGATCNDSNACTSGDVCRSDGTCRGNPLVADGGLLPTCNDLERCTINDRCQPDGTCRGTTVAEGAACPGFGQFGCEGYACRSGQCTYGNLDGRSCSAPEGQCWLPTEVGTCSGGQCQGEPAPSGTTCDPGGCQAGTCDGAGGCVGTGQPAVGRSCGTDGCQALACDANFQCVLSGTAPNGTACSNECAAYGAECQNGVCEPIDGGINVGNYCTPPEGTTSCMPYGRCDSDGLCEPVQNEPGTPCYDYSGETPLGLCEDSVCDEAGECLDTTVRSEFSFCGDNCNPGSCDAEGQCQQSNPVQCVGGGGFGNNEFASDVRASSSRAAATLVSTSGGTGSDPACWEEQGVCVPEYGSCSYSPKPSDTPCDDGDLCTTLDHCNGCGTCVPGRRKLCDSPPLCYLALGAACEPETGQCVYPEAEEGTPCDLGNLCIVDTACDGLGQCVGEPRNCDDGLACTADSCDPTAGCVNTISDGFCVIDGQCVPAGAQEPVQNQELVRATRAAALGVGQTNPCRTCQPSISTNRYSDVMNGTQCSDGDVCNGMETCQMGACSEGAPLNCDDGLPCTTDNCDPVAGCLPIPQPGFCIISRSCVPVGAADPSSPCRTCQPTVNLTVYSNVQNGTSCSDGNVCNGMEVCQSGACAPGAALNCDDQMPCTTDSCDPVAGCRNVLQAGSCRIDGQCVAGGAMQPGNPCRSCQPNISTAAYSPVANGTSCADASLCNGAETCQQGACAPGTTLDCDDKNPCTADSCDPVLGCVHTPVANGTTCSDGRFCNGMEVCQSGQCTAGTPPSCNDDEVCTLDRCDEEVGACINTPVANGTTCSDGNACNGTETCQEGSCEEGTPLECDDGNPCTAESCDPVAGCRSTPVEDGASCDDGNACNGVDRCERGVCTPREPPRCDDGNPCTVDSCDPEEGCRSVPVADSTPCSDGNVCNGLELCQGGVCRPGTSLGCNDNNPCTADSCDPSRGCVATPVADGTSCSDGQACNGAEACRAGVCTPGEAVVCNAPPVCRTAAGASCNPETGQCSYPLAPTGTSCSDGNACNGAETCAEGVCTSGTPLVCNDGNPCTADSCDPERGCVATPVANGTSCSDGNACNGAETCREGVCAAGEPVRCESPPVCRTAAGASCNPETGQCSYPLAPTGTSCSDGNACNGAETCAEGVCTNGTPPVCNDGNPCTADSCEPQRGCVATPVANGTSCSDGNACNGVETCRDGVCAADAPVRCVSPPPCRTALGATCDRQTGACNYPSLTDGAPCSDGNECNGLETCRSGACTAGTPPNCNGGNPCLAYTCEPGRGCVATPIADGTSCSDGNVCNGAETCREGTCVAGEALRCNDGNPCTADRCDPVRGCLASAVADGTSCSDGNPCNGGESCRAGVCQPGTPLRCEDANPCTADSCDPQRGCVFTPVTDGTACGDDNRCNGAETCQAGACRSGPPLVCTDGNACTTDSCDPARGCVQTPISCDDGNSCTTDSCDPVNGCANVCLADRSACGAGSLGTCVDCRCVLLDATGSIACSNCSNTEASMPMPWFLAMFFALGVWVRRARRRRATR